MVADLRRWLDDIEEDYGPNFALESYAFVTAVGFTRAGEKAEAGESYARTAVGYYCSDSRGWVQVGLLRRALLIAESGKD